MDRNIYHWVASNGHIKYFYDLKTRDLLRKVGEKPARISRLTPKAFKRCLRVGAIAVLEGRKELKLDEVDW